MRVKITELAEKDLEEAFLFYVRQQVGLGSHFLDTLFSDIDSLSFYGGIHLKL